MFIHAVVAIVSDGRISGYRMGELWAWWGIPGPSTGMTRALVAAWHGRWSEAFQWSPLGLPLAVGFSACIAGLFWGRFRWGVWRLPGWAGWALLGITAAAWVAKLMQPPAWW